MNPFAYTKLTALHLVDALMSSITLRFTVAVCIYMCVLVSLFLSISMHHD